MTTTAAFLRLYTEADDPIGDLWQYDSLSISRARKPDPDSASITVRRNTPSAHLLDRDFLFARAVVNGVLQPWLFVLNETKEDPRDADGEVRSITASFVGIEKWLENAQVYPENHDPGVTGALTQDTSTDGNPLVMGHRFADANAGTIMSTLIDAAHARGAITRLSYDFSAASDSNSVAWTTDDEMDETYTIGQTYKAVLDSIAGIGWCHYRFDDWTLKLFRPDTLGTDQTDVVLRRSQYITSGPRSKRRLDAKTAMLVHGEQIALYERVDAVAKAALGRREGFYRRSGVYQLDTITKLAQLALDTQKNVLESLTLTVVADECPFVPGVDFDLWDTIYYDAFPGEPMRVNTITQSWDAQGSRTFELELLDRLSDQADRLSKLLERIRQPNAPDATLPDRIDPIPTIPPSDSDYWTDWSSSYADYVTGTAGGYFGMVYIQPNEPEGVGKGTFWFDTDDFSV